MKSWHLAPGFLSVPEHRNLYFDYTEVIPMRSDNVTKGVDRAPNRSLRLPLWV